MASRKAASIDAESTVVTLINVYEVERERQAELAGLLAEATEKVMRHQPGFVSVKSTAASTEPASSTMLSGRRRTISTA